MRDSACSNWFRDAVGRRWSIELDLDTEEALLDELGMRSFTMLTGDLSHLSDLLSSAERFVGLLYIVCREQIEIRGMTAEAFAHGLGHIGEPNRTRRILDNAAAAFLRALADRHTNHPIAGRLRKLAHTMRS